MPLRECLHTLEWNREWMGEGSDVMCELAERTKTGGDMEKHRTMSRRSVNVNIFSRTYSTTERRVIGRVMPIGDMFAHHHSSAQRDINGAHVL